MPSLTYPKIIDKFLDITNEICPMTFVKTKLAIESIKIGGVVEVRLKGREPLENVPLSVVEHGHTIISSKLEDPNNSEEGVYLLLIRKEK